MPEPWVVASEVAVEFGATTVFEGVGFIIARGERWGIVGRNGSGKTTLLNVVVGALEPSSGTLTRAADLHVTLLDQHRTFPGATSIWDAAAGPFEELRALERSLATQAEALSRGNATPADLTRYDRDLERFRREDGYVMEARVDAVLQGLGFDPSEARRRSVGELSGGEAGRVGLARQLVAPADLVLLDEPTNHLDLTTTRWLEEYLQGLDVTVLVISHDREFLENVTDHTLHFEAGTATPYSGSYGAFVEQHAERALTQERAWRSQRRTIAKEEDFIRRNIAGQLSRQAKGRRKRLARLPRLSPPPSEEDVMSLRLEPAERGGNQVIVIEDMALQVGERTLLEGFSARIHRGEVVGLVGANGMGKSTLLNAIAGASGTAAGRTPGTGEGRPGGPGRGGPLASGTIRPGASIEVAYYRQDMNQIPNDRSLFDIVYDLRHGWDRGKVQAHLGRFGFPGESVRRRARTLSGGERARVALAMLVLSRANFLLLDEPTNHLDVESVEALEDALDGFEGTVLLVSHDRALLRNLVTRVWSLEDGRIDDYPGTFSEWEESRAREDAAPEKPDRPAKGTSERSGRTGKAASGKSGRNAERSGPRGRPDPERTRLRALRSEVEASEAEIHELESRAGVLERDLADGSLYESADGVRKAVGMKEELAGIRARLSVAIERWTRAGEELAGIEPS